MQEEIKAVILDERAMERAIARITYEIIERNKGVENLCLVGILSRGADLAIRIAEKIGRLEQVAVPVAKLDITCFRDDGKRPEGYADQSDLPFDVTGKRIVLVDDVIYTGRSARAAMDSLMSRGRPPSIQLALLVDRGHRELPIRADYIGKNLPTSSTEKVHVLVREQDGVDKVYIN